jgi:hypothetical protein
MRNHAFSGWIFGLVWLVCTLPFAGCVGAVGQLEAACSPYTSQCDESGDFLEVCSDDGMLWHMVMFCTDGCSNGICMGMRDEAPPRWGAPPADEFYQGSSEPPQAPGNDFQGVAMALPLEDAVVPIPSQEMQGGWSIGIEITASTEFSILAGQWFEPKDGRCQRLMYHGIDVHLVDPGTYELDGFFCMQHENWGPSAHGYFSEPKEPDGPIQECQRDCGPDQVCIWDCEDLAQ